jgi:hypothetical protein
VSRCYPAAVRKVFAWYRSHRRWTPIALLAALCLLHFSLNWSAEWRWQRYCREARVRGVKLTLVEFTRSEIPDGINFAALPMMQDTFAGRGKDTFSLPNPPGSYRYPLFENAVKGTRMDWVSWRLDFQRAGLIKEFSSDPVRDVLRALDSFAPQFREWSEWRNRPQCRFPLDLQQGPDLALPHLSIFRDAARVFSMRMRAHLALGDSAAAYADFREGFQVYHALREEPMVIMGYTRTSAVLDLIAAAGNGLRDHAWASEELRKIEADLATIHVMEDYGLALSSARAEMNSFRSLLVDASTEERRKLAADMSRPGSGEAFLDGAFLRLIPNWVSRDNQLRENRYIDELLARVDSTGRRIDLTRPAPSAPDNITGRVGKVHYFLYGISGPIQTATERQYLRTQVRLDLAGIACALERFHQARGDFPPTLNELAPDFVAELPVDPYAAGPYRYRRGEEGSFRLYSIGPNRRDDQGKLDVAKSERNQADDIWLYAPPIPAP